MGYYTYGARRQHGTTKTGLIDAELRGSDFQAKPNDIVEYVLEQLPELAEGKDLKEVKKGLKALVFSRRAVLAKKATAPTEKVEETI